MTNTNSTAPNRSEEPTPQTSVITKPTFDYHSPFAQAELRSLSSYSDSSSNSTLSEANSPFDEHPPTYESDTSYEVSNKDESLQEAQVNVNQPEQATPPPKRETIEERAQRLSEQIQIQTASVRAMDLQAEDWRREIARFRALCDDYEKFKDGAMDKIVGMERQKRWVDTQLRIVETESAVEALGMILGFYVSRPRTVSEVCGFMVVVAGLMFWKFWQLRG